MPISCSSKRKAPGVGNGGEPLSFSANNNNRIDVRHRHSHRLSPLLESISCETSNKFNTASNKHNHRARQKMVEGRAIGTKRQLFPPLAINDTKRIHYPDHQPTVDEEPRTQHLD